MPGTRVPMRPARKAAGPPGPGRTSDAPDAPDAAGQGECPSCRLAACLSEGIMSVGRNGEGGIRTRGTGISPYTGLANRRIQPLCHLSGRRDRLAACPIRRESPMVAPAGCRQARSTPGHGRGNAMRASSMSDCNRHGPRAQTTYPPGAGRSRMVAVMPPGRQCRSGRSRRTSGPVLRRTADDARFPCLPDAEYGVDMPAAGTDLPRGTGLEDLVPASIGRPAPGDPPRRIDRGGRRLAPGTAAGPLQASGDRMLEWWAAVMPSTRRIAVQRAHTARECNSQTGESNSGQVLAPPGRRKPFPTGDSGYTSPR